MTLIVEATEPVLVDIAGDERKFPVRHVYCIGRNYVDHAKEMGLTPESDPKKNPPFFFMKYADTIVPTGSTIVYPLGTENYHWELELAVAIGKEGVKIPASQAKEYILAYGVGFDMTRRDLQQGAKDKGRPWDTGKNVVQSAPVAPLHLVSEVGHIEDARIWLEVNGEVKQDSNVSDMIWDTYEIIEAVSNLYRLYPGDLILTGTPAGVGACVPGDHLVGHVDGLTSIDITIGDRES